MHLHSITGTCSTKDNGVERHNQSVSNFDEKESDNPVRNTVSHFQAQNNNRIYLDNIHMDHIYTQYKGLKVYNGYSYWYLTYDMHQ
jgi:hypothetical protein